MTNPNLDWGRNGAQASAQFGKLLLSKAALPAPARERLASSAALPKSHSELKSGLGVAQISDAVAARVRGGRRMDEQAIKACVDPGFEVRR